MIYTLDEWNFIIKTISNALYITEHARPCDNPEEDNRAIMSIEHTIAHIEHDILDAKEQPMVLTGIIDWR